MSIHDVRAAIQTLNKTFERVTYVYDGHDYETRIRHAPLEQPNKLTADAMPCALVFATTGAWIYETFGPPGAACRRVYDVRVYVAPSGQGVDGEVYARAEALLQAMGAAYIANVDIDDSVWHDWTITDTGIIGDDRMTFAGQAHIGFIFRLEPETWE